MIYENIGSDYLQSDKKKNTKENNKQTICKNKRKQQVNKKKTKEFCSKRCGQFHSQYSRL